MSTPQIIENGIIASKTDLRRNPSSSLKAAGDSSIAVLNRNKPAAYLLSARAFEALLGKLDDAELTKIVKERQGGETVKVNVKIYGLEFNLDAQKEWRKLDGSIQAQFKQQLTLQLCEKNGCLRFSVTKKPQDATSAYPLDVDGQQNDQVGVRQVNAQRPFASAKAGPHTDAQPAQSGDKIVATFKADGLEM